MESRNRKIKRPKIHTVNDPIHPNYYYGDAVMHVIELAGMGVSFCLGNCAKYTLRAGNKLVTNRVQVDEVLTDLKKAQWYLTRAIDALEGKIK
jgi:hypothetical protein